MQTTTEPKTYKSLLPELKIQYKTGNLNKVKITSSRESADFFRKLYDDDLLDYIESAIVMYLNRANTTIGWMKVSMGGITGTVMDPRVIVSTALQCGAVSFIISHNHPSGNLNPSDADNRITQQLKQAASFFDMKLLDHIIITREGYYSYADEGMI